MRVVHPDPDRDPLRDAAARLGGAGPGGPAVRSRQSPRAPEFIAATWEELGGPCSRGVIEQAHAFATSREAAFDPRAAVLVHGGAHSANALRSPAHASAPARFKLVDPDGLLAEPAYDLAIPMREWRGELLDGDPVRLGRERCAYLGRLTGVHPRGIWEWGFVERVSTGLLATRVGADRMGREMLGVAEAWAMS
jgi:streptomycin 6-kinase